MTKLQLLIATGLTLGVSAICAPAFAQHSHQGGYAPMVGANDPCLLGSNAASGACAGPVRVAPMVMSQGPVHLQPMNSQSVSFNSQPASYVQPVAYTQPTYAPQSVSYAHPAVMPQSYAAPAQSTGCVPGYNAPGVGCSGNWVYAPQAAPQPMMQPAPQYAPPAQYLPAPVAYAPQPQQIGMIPTSFFTGGITYGAGFPTENTYTYGGGGFGFSTGGTRFSGVRERSPTPLIAPPMRQRHAPPAHHHGGCCK